MLSELKEKRGGFLPFIGGALYMSKESAAGAEKKLELPSTIPHFFSLANPWRKGDVVRLKRREDMVG